VKVNPSPLFIHVKQKNEMVYTPLYVTPTNLTGLSEAITKKFHVSETSFNYDETFSPLNLL